MREPPLRLPSTGARARPPSLPAARRYLRTVHWALSLALSLSGPVLAQSTELKPVRVTGYFDWRAGGGKSDGDYRSAQREAFPELLTAGKSLALVRAVTVDGRTTLRVLPGFERVVEQSERRLFSAETSIPPEAGGSGEDLFGTGRRPAVIASFGGGLFRVVNYTFASGTQCDTAQIDLTDAFQGWVEGRAADLGAAVVPISCRDVIDVLGIGEGSERAYVVFDGAAVTVARRQGASIVDVSKRDLKAWLGGDRRLLFASSVEHVDQIHIALAVDDGKGSHVCLVSVARSELLAGRLPRSGCPEAPVFRAERDRIVIEVSWRADGRAIAVLQTDQRTRLSDLSLVESGTAKRLSNAVLIPQAVNVPYVAKPTLAWMQGRLYWLEAEGRTSYVATFDGKAVVRFGLPEERPTSSERCGLARAWSSQAELACDPTSGTAERATAVLGRTVTLDEAFARDANWFSKAPAWIPVQCGRDTASLVRAARLRDISWFVPFRWPARGRTFAVAGVVVDVAADGIDDFPYTPRPRLGCDGKRSNGVGIDAVNPLPPVQRVAVFEVPQ